MKNLVLKRGDFVKALCDVETSSGLLFKGQVYPVDVAIDGALCVATIDGIVELVRRDGTLTDATLDVAIVKRRDVLPRGQA